MGYIQSGVDSKQSRLRFISEISLAKALDAVGDLSDVCCREETTVNQIEGIASLHFNPRDQKWNFAYRGKFYLWEGEPFDREDAERLARSIIARVQRTLVGIDGREVVAP